MAMVYTRKCSDHICDVGVDNACAKLMQLCAADDSLTDNFEEVTTFIRKHLREIITSVHNMDKDSERLMADDGVTLVNCPPAPEPGDNHGGLLVRTYSEKIENEHIVLAREFKVHSIDENQVEVRYELTRDKGSATHDHIEQKVIITV
eukprot:CFRG6879T1